MLHNFLSKWLNRHNQPVVQSVSDELKKYRLVLDQAPAAVYIIDKNMCFEYVNPCFCSQSGYTREELLNKSIKDTIYQGEMFKEILQISEALKQGKAWQGEILMRQKSGDFFWVSTIASPFVNELGITEGHVVIQQDISDHKKMEIALQESENLYRTLIESSLDGVILTQDFKLLYFNKVFLEMMGYSYNELISVDPTSILAPEERELILSYHNKRMRGEVNNQNYSATFVRKDGSRFLAELNATSVNISGKTASLIAMRDITEREKLQNALRESEAKYKVLVESSQDNIFIIRDNQVLYANQTYCKMLGYSFEELYSMPSVSIIHPDDRHKAFAIAERRRSLDFSTINEVFRMVTKSGEIRECETTSTVVEYGEVWVSFFTSHDITESKRMQQALAKSERRFRELTQMLPQAIYELDANGKPTFMNRSGRKMFLMSDNEASDKMAYDFFAPEDMQKMKVALEREAQSVQYINYELEPFNSEPAEYTARRGDGSTFPVLIYGTPIVEDGNVTGSRGIIIDISERKAMENAIRESETRYKMLVEHSQDGILIIQKDKITYANAAICRMLDCSNEEVIGKSVFDYLESSYVPLAESVMERRDNGDDSNIFMHFQFRNKKNELIEAETISSFLEINGEKVAFYTIHDLTEQKRMQSELIESERKYREIADFLPQTIFELDIKGNLLYINKTGMEIFGLSEQNYGKTCYQSFEETEYDALRQNLRTILDGKKTELIYEYKARNKEGRSFPIMTYSLPVFRNNLLIGIRGMVIDISEQKATEQILQESEKKYRELAEMLPQTVYELDNNGNLTYLNKTGREKFGTDYETNPVQVFSFVLPEQKEQMKSNFLNVTERFISSKGNIYTLQQKDGQLIDVMISATPIIVEGKSAGSRGVVIDVSEHIGMQKALSESEEKYRSLIENATDGIVIVQDGLLKFANQQMCEIMQYTLAQLQEKPFLSFIDRADHEVLIRFHGRRMRGEQFSNIFRSRFIRKDGKYITVELNARTSNFNGSPAGFIVIRDITDRLKTENELKIAKAELEKLNNQLEKRIIESSDRLAETRTQLLNLQKENLQSQFEVLRQQVNPHFLFNSLNVLTSLIKLEPDLAEQFSEHLSKVYRYVLENKDNEFVDLHTELRFLDAYIFLLNIRFIGKIKVNIEIPSHKRSCLIIPLAMQLLIENAIKHNIMTKSDPLVIDIFIDEKNYLNIINNLQERPSQLISTGVGLKNIQNRYMLLNNTEPIFKKTENQFVAMVPLIDKEM